MSASWLVIGIGLIVSSCGIGDCAPLSTTQTQLAPPTLQDTGLYANKEHSSLATGVQTYAPRFQLWSDGAAKRRFVLLPEDTQVDTSDMNDWRFPVGTKFWKEFSRDGQVLETRLLHKYGPEEEDWLMVAYVWDRQGSVAKLALEGEDDVLGTAHDVPRAQDCAACHAGTHGRVLGFSAVQLSQVDASEGRSSPLGLQALVETGRLTQPPIEPIALPGSELDQQALGYLHANCGSCHNQARPPRGQHRCYDPERDLDLSLRVEQLESVTSTPAYRTGVGKSLIPGEPGESSLVSRSSRRFYRHMPPLATEDVDEQGVNLLERWIASLKPQPDVP